MIEPLKQAKNFLKFDKNLWNIHEIGDMLKLYIDGRQDLGVGVSKGLGDAPRWGVESKLGVEIRYTLWTKISSLHRHSPN